MRSLIAIAIYLASMHCVRSETQEATTLLVSCEKLMRQMQTFIDIQTDTKILYSRDTCMSTSLMKMFLRESGAMLDVQHSKPHNVNITFAQDDEGLAGILVLALIGRHYTAEFKTGQVFFEFNSATQLLTPKMPRCEYQRSFFVLLLFVSIVLLIFALVVQNLNTIESNSLNAAHHQDVVEAIYPPLASAPPLPQPVKPSNFNPHVSIDFAYQRRPLLQYSAI